METETIRYREISQTEFKHIYTHYMTVDFPEDELKSYEQIVDLFNKRLYTCYVMEMNNRIKGYACVVSQHAKVKLIDYFAVNKQDRGAGYGSLMLNWLFERLLDQTLLIECEDPNVATTSEERLIREKRISFYEKNGCQQTGVGVQIVGVDYVILQYSLLEISAADTKEYLIQIYNAINPLLVVQINE